VNVGDLVAPGRPLIRIQTENGRKLHFSVRAADGARVNAGAVIECTLDNSGKRVNATVAEVSPAADPITHTIAVSAVLADADSLAAGHTAVAEIPCELTTAILVPSSAVFVTGGLTLATIVDDNGLARTRAVTIGRMRGDEIEILSGLKSGDVVVLERTGLIAEGTRIERVNG